MKFGLMSANAWPHEDPELAAALVVAAESAGFDSVWTVEHVIWPTQYESAYPYRESGKMPGEPSTPIPDPVVWLAWVAGVTSTIKLGTGVLLLPERNPVVLAKALATLDRLSRGRLLLGIGVGWLREEFAALGIPFERRGARTDEYLASMQILWSEDNASFDGEFVSFTDVSSNPKPHGGNIPVVIGGHSRAAARRAARFGDGFFPGPGSVELLAMSLQALREECDKVGRDVSEIEVSVAYPGRYPDLGAAIDELAELGVARLMVPAFRTLRPTLEEGMAAWAADIGAHSS